MTALAAALRNLLQPSKAPGDRSGLPGIAANRRRRSGQR